ncbi:MAG: hypothetical protein HY016_03670 [Nitrosomonadales bacterium]|nr:hypothetical protein [Nitrosomonadales bacterium]
MKIGPCINLNCRWKFDLPHQSVWGALLFALLITPVYGGAPSLPPDSTSAEIGISVLRFNYAEYGDGGTLMDQELGTVPGLSFRFTHRRSGLETEGVASYHYGSVNYTGQSTLGAPAATTTNESIGDVALRLGYWLDTAYPVMPYAGIGYHGWDRNILPVGNVSGLLESYRWAYMWLGAKLLAYQQDTSSLAFDLGWIRPITPLMDVDYYNARVYPSGGNGLRLLMTSHWALDNNTALILEPYIEYWSLGRSPNVATSQGCSPNPPPCIIHEPESDTRNFGLNMRLGVAF